MQFSFKFRIVFYVRIWVVRLLYAFTGTIKSLKGSLWTCILVIKWIIVSFQCIKRLKFSISTLFCCKFLSNFIKTLVSSEKRQTFWTIYLKAPHYITKYDSPHKSITVASKLETFPNCLLAEIPANLPKFRENCRLSTLCVWINTPDCSRLAPNYVLVGKFISY